MIKKIKYFKFKRPYVLVPMSLDFLHHGHINILAKSKKLGNIIVALSTDDGILSYKKKKTSIPYKERFKIASSLKYVSYVIPSRGPEDFSKLAKRYKCEFVVHGDDWKKGLQAKYRKKLIATMKEWKGKVIDLPYTKKISSTIIKSNL
tara:strand:+ start:214 stop:657 length:444 start_codon:yes stop_codon:yes gene_type:complete